MYIIIINIYMYLHIYLHVSFLVRPENGRCWFVEISQPVDPSQVISPSSRNKDRSLRKVLEFMMGFSSAWYIHIYIYIYTYIVIYLYIHIYIYCIYSISHIWTVKPHWSGWLTSHIQNSKTTCVVVFVCPNSTNLKRATRNSTRRGSVGIRWTGSIAAIAHCKSSAEASVVPSGKQLQKTIKK